MRGRLLVLHVGCARQACRHIFHTRLASTKFGHACAQLFANVLASLLAFHKNRHIHKDILKHCCPREAQGGSESRREPQRASERPCPLLIEKEGMPLAMAKSRNHQTCYLQVFRKSLSLLLSGRPSTAAAAPRGNNCEAQSC